jgi:hypothetical protein
MGGERGLEKLLVRKSTPSEPRKRRRDAVVDKRGVWSDFLLLNMYNLEARCGLCSKSRHARRTRESQQQHIELPNDRNSQELLLGFPTKY